MVSRRELHRTGRKVFVKPLVVLAAKCLGPGRLRLEMVKLAHDLGDRDGRFAFTGRGQTPGFPRKKNPAPGARLATPACSIEAHLPGQNYLRDPEYSRCGRRF